LWLALGLVAINLLVFLLLTTSFQPWLDKVVTNSYDEILKDARSTTQQYFSSGTADHWENTATALGNKLNTRCSIVPRNKHNFTATVLKRLQQPSANQGLIDPVEHFIYYPLDKDFVAVIDPPPYPQWLQVLGEDIHWLVAIIFNVLLVYLYLRHREKQWSILERELLKLPGIESVDTDTPDILDRVRQLQTVLAYNRKEHRSLLTLQRDLLHGVAHEFRSPMARIQFALEMLEDADEEEQYELRNGIHQALNDLDKLVQELLYYARLKDSQSEVIMAPVILNTLLASCIDQVSEFYPQTRFYLHADPDNTPVLADERLMKRMIVNLLRNAGRFADSQCKISFQHSDQNTRIKVEDDGTGIPPGKTQRIFEPFTRLDPSRSRDSGGCGLGLAIVASIVSKHQWSIAISDSNLGGACFEISIPDR
jgi:two-component system sensor histidine kinase RstB